MLAARQNNEQGFRVMVKHAIHYTPLFGWYIFQVSSDNFQVDILNKPENLYKFQFLLFFKRGSLFNVLVRWSEVSCVLNK